MNFLHVYTNLARGKLKLQCACTWSTRKDCVLTDVLGGRVQEPAGPSCGASQPHKFCRGGWCSALRKVYTHVDTPRARHRWLQLRLPPAASVAARAQKVRRKSCLLQWFYRAARAPPNTHRGQAQLNHDLGRAHLHERSSRSFSLLYTRINRGYCVCAAALHRTIPPRRLPLTNAVRAARNGCGVVRRQNGVGRGRRVFDD